MKLSHFVVNSDVITGKDCRISVMFQWPETQLPWLRDFSHRMPSLVLFGVFDKIARVLLLQTLLLYRIVWIGLRDPEVLLQILK